MSGHVAAPLFMQARDPFGQVLVPGTWTWPLSLAGYGDGFADVGGRGRQRILDAERAVDLSQARATFRSSLGLLA